MPQTGAARVYACQLSPDNIHQMQAFLVRHNLQLRHTLVNRCEPGDYILLSVRQTNNQPRSAQPLTQNVFGSRWSWKSGDAFDDIFLPVKWIGFTVPAG